MPDDADDAVLMDRKKNFFQTNPLPLWSLPAVTLDAIFWTEYSLSYFSTAYRTKQLGAHQKFVSVVSAM